MAEAAVLQPIHATTVARRLGGDWVGVALTGPSGSGKSDLALRLIAEGWRLIADDYSTVWASGGAVYASAPSRIAGLIEARGLGVLPVSRPTRAIVRLILVVACSRTSAERAPELKRTRLAGVTLPCVAIDTRPASATALAGLALAQALAAAGNVETGRF